MKKKKTTTKKKDDPMSVLSTDQIVTLAQNVGFQGSDLATAVAIALAESNPPGNTQSINTGEPHGSSYGLWQIYLFAHPTFDPNRLLSDPEYNAQAAYQVFLEAGSSFRPWTTYNNGKYLGFLPGVEATIAAMSPPQSPPPPFGIPAEPSSSDITNGTTPATDGSTVSKGDVSSMLPPILIALAAIWFWSR